MKVCPRCWTRYHDDKSICKYCKIKLYSPQELTESKMDPHFRIIKDQKHRIHSVHRDKVSHEIMNFDEKKHHEFHHKGSFLRESDIKHIFRLLISPAVIIVVTVVVMLIIITLIRKNGG